MESFQSLMISNGHDRRRTDLSVKAKIATQSPGVKTGLSSLATKNISEWVERQGKEIPVLTLCYPHALLRCTGVSCHHGAAASHGHYDSVYQTQ